MKKIYILICFVFTFSGIYGQPDDDWQAQWITAVKNQDATNTWLLYRKKVNINNLPSEPVTANIAVDSKYWLWINGQRVVFEGGLKRGPSPEDTYYDAVDIGDYLKEGENKIVLLQWYFGKNGFSHNSSGKAAMIFDCRHKNISILSDNTWEAALHPAYENTLSPHPNYRLPESNIRFDAREGDFTIGYNYEEAQWRPAKTLGTPPVEPWNQLVKRHIPQWKDYGLKDYENDSVIPQVSRGDTLSMELPYNAHVTPYLKVKAPAGKTIEIRTDHYRGGGPPNVRSEYVTKEGVQEYESYGWMNGHHVRYYIPEGVEIQALKYRETGYNTEFAGSFESGNEFFNRMWKKSARTLYVTMRDTYMDCPDRERALWWGDAVNESGEAFYALDTLSHDLARKNILELIQWQRPDSTLYSPIPSGNWDRELPGQMLASVGYYGFWNYYLNTDDHQTITRVLDGVKKYLAKWKLNDQGVLNIRKGDWTWGDWGENKDITLLYNAWYYLALRGYVNMVAITGNNEEATRVAEKMAGFRKAFNQVFWNGEEYRSSDYSGKTDDRSQALAVVAGLAGEDKYEEIYRILQNQFHASPYMEKYVIEALFMMGYPDFGLERMKKRFSKMVNHPEITTLWEGWGIGSEGYGGGTVNHAWSGGGLTILSQYVAGLSPTAPGFQQFEIKPQLGYLNEVNTVTPTVQGKINISVQKDNGEYYLNTNVPVSTQAVIQIPAKYKDVAVNGNHILIEGEIEYDAGFTYQGEEDGYHLFSVESGDWKFKAW